MDKLDCQFYNRPTLEVAKDLLGKVLVKREKNYVLRGRIVETEAYIGAIDKAAHCYGNKMTPRTRVMFGEPGRAYVYLIYGMYYCLNVVTEPEGAAAAVLIRGIEPLEGMEAMAYNRYQRELDSLTKPQLKGLTNGPGKLCKAFNITKEHNEAALWSERFYITDTEAQPFEIVTTKRINIDYAQEAIDFPWRYYIKNNPYVSKK